MSYETRKREWFHVRLKAKIAMLCYNNESKGTNLWQNAIDREIWVYFLFLIAVQFRKKYSENIIIPQ